jgi:1-acyl-sn-glycerol-3-phosphate acyltransferase
MRRSLGRVRRIVLTGSAFLLFFTGGALLSYVLMPIARRRASDAADAMRRCRGLLAGGWRFFHWYMAVCGLLRYDPRATRLALPDGAFVLVANHPTLVDVTAIISACPDAVSLVKHGMYRSPLVGRLLRYCGHVDAGDGSAFAGVAAAEAALALLRAGTPVLIFPEGTRSPELGVGVFRTGAFELAARAGVPIVPLFVTCDPPTLMRGQRWYEVPERTATLTVSPMPTLSPPFDPRAAARELRSIYRQRLDALRTSRLPADGAEPIVAGSTAAAP